MKGYVAKNIRHNHVWTEEERLIIRRDYRHTRKSRREIAAKLGVTEYGVAGQVSSMGIAKSDDRRLWTEAEVSRLRELMESHCPRAVARLMKRTVNSVTVKSKRLNIHRRNRFGWFTKMEVCQILGHDHKWVQARIDAGTLKATWHHEKKPCQNGMASWHIDEAQLVAFIRTYPEELVGCNIDIVQIVDMLAQVIND